ncbi:hypothetical protein NQ315_016777 [Exocentrus adspersus]|uniref:Glucosylceramidase n=1 Tax=Exocentrus adspersus TaxID=1586481 RepID=A0AAV8VDL5_9CUCU|nr:hypothetical protein NQ315_016777 [Exocentrus adspersus]
MSDYARDVLGKGLNFAVDPRVIPKEEIISALETTCCRLPTEVTEKMKWLKQNLGPSLRKSIHKDLKIIIHDDARLTIPYVVPLMLNDEETLKYIDGIGVHWYWDDRIPSDVLSLTKTKKKDVFLLETESCIFREGVVLGSWNRAAAYIGSIIEYLELGFGGWMDWNMALSLSGGPTYIGYESDSPILINATSQEFYKQPMFYAMGHFSKFVVPGSVRLNLIHNIEEKEAIKAMAFLRPDRSIAVLIFNNATTSFTLSFQINSLYSSALEIEPKSIYTVVCPKEQ